MALLYSFICCMKETRAHSLKDLQVWFIKIREQKSYKRTNRYITSVYKLQLSVTDYKFSNSVPNWTHKPVYISTQVVYKFIGFSYVYSS